jgi:hypothetical protein
VPFACDAVALSIPNRGLELDTVDDLHDRAEIREDSEPSARSLQHSSRTFAGHQLLLRSLRVRPLAGTAQKPRSRRNDPPEIDPDLDPDQICSAQTMAAAKLSLNMG